MPQTGVADMTNAFFDNDKATLAVMVQADNPDRIKQLIDLSEPCGAEAFGMQFEQLKKEFRNEKTYRELFSYSSKPTYITNYRHTQNEGKSDDELAEEMLEFAEYGAELCDIMGDYFDRQPDEMAVDETAIAKQMKLIEKLHEKGAKVLMSSHIYKFTPCERVLEIALEQQRRGADICKIVTGATNAQEEIENLKIIDVLKQNLKIPFLFLCTDKCDILRRIGGEIGNCMYLCVYEHDALATAAQPLLCDVKAIRDAMANR